jgi:hypothetical protein
MCEDCIYKNKQFNICCEKYSEKERDIYVSLTRKCEEYLKEPSKILFDEIKILYKQFSLIKKFCVSEWELPVLIVKGELKNVASEY